MKILFMSAREACQLTPDLSAEMISITDPGERSPVQPGWSRLLHVQFEDVEYDSDTKRLLGEQLFREAYAGAISQEQAGRIRTFIAGIRKSTVSTLHIHCHRGRSRSTAVARYASEVLSVPLEQVPTTYNALVYRMLTGG